MLTTRQKEKREKIKARLQKLKYRLFQAEIAFVCHDNEKLKDMAQRIGINSRRITGLLSEKRKTARKKRKSGAREITIR